MKKHSIFLYYKSVTNLSPRRQVHSFFTTLIDIGYYLNDAYTDPHKKRPQSNCPETHNYHLRLESYFFFFFPFLFFFFFELLYNGQLLQHFPFFSTFLQHFFLAITSLRCIKYYCDTITYYFPCFSIESKSTSNTRTELGSIIGGAPCSPYASEDGTTTR